MTAEQSQRFDKLESMLAALDQSMDPSATAETLGRDIYLNQVRRDDHTVSLQACAAAIFSSASTAAGRSTSGGTALINDAPAFEFIGESTAGVPDGMHGVSTTGSVYGEPLDLRKKIQMHDWLREIIVTGGVLDTPSTIDGSISHRNTAVSSLLINPYANSDGSLTQRKDGISSDMFCEPIEDDDELDYEVVRNLFRKAENSLITQDHASAKALFQEGFVIADNLRVQRQNSLQLGQIRMRYADCCCFINDFTSAEHAYQKVMEEQPLDTLTLERILTAGHNLSIVKLRQQDTEAAEKYCRRALNGRRKAQSIGKDHPDYHLTLRLLTIILWAKGAHVQARQYVELLPGTSQPNLGRELEILTGFTPMAKHWLYSTSSNVEANAKDFHAEVPKGRINVEGSVDRFHPSKSSSGAIEAKQGENRENLDLDQSGRVSDRESQMLSEIPRLVQCNLKHPHLKNKRSKSSKYDQRHRHTSQSIQSTSQQESTATAKPVSIIISAVMAAEPWLPAIEFVHRLDSRPVGTNLSLKFESILKVLSQGGGTIWVNPGSQRRDENTNNDPTVPTVKLPSELLQNSGFHCLSENEGEEEVRYHWFFEQSSFIEYVSLNGNEVKRDLVKVQNGDVFRLDSARGGPWRFVFQVRLLMCREVNGGFERRPIVTVESVKMKDVSFSSSREETI